MRTYNIMQNSFQIGVARGKSAAFSFIQKEVDRNGLKGYWAGNRYIGNDNTNYSMEVSNNE